MRVRSEAYKARRALRHAKRRAAQVARYVRENPAEAQTIARQLPMDQDHYVRMLRRATDPTHPNYNGRDLDDGAARDELAGAAIWDAHEDFGRDDWKTEPFA